MRGDAIRDKRARVVDRLARGGGGCLRGGRAFGELSRKAWRRIMKTKTQNPVSITHNDWS